MDKKYWEDLNKYPPLKKEEEKELAIKAKAGDRKAYEKLINSNLRFVVNIAKEYTKQGIELEELIGYGNLGLCKAFKKFDPEKNIKFITYAVWWIKQTILQALNENNRLIKLPQWKFISNNTINNTRDKLEKKHQREISTAELEEELGEYFSLSTSDIFKVISLDKSFTKDGKKSLQNAINDEDAIDPEANIEHESFLTELDLLLDGFEDREKTIIKYYYGIGIVRNMTLEEIGIEFGITRERVRQIKEKILEKLRHFSRKDKLQPYLDILKSEILHDMSSSK
jgi:RNA polymerase primary sigma factor